MISLTNAQVVFRFIFSPLAIGGDSTLIYGRNVFNFDAHMNRFVILPLRN